MVNLLKQQQHYDNVLQQNHRLVTVGAMALWYNGLWKHDNNVSWTVLFAFTSWTVRQEQNVFLVGQEDGWNVNESIMSYAQLY